MSLISFDIEELDKNQIGWPCLYCLVIAGTYMNLVTCKVATRQSLHIYQTERSREYGLRHWRHEYKLAEVVFFKFEIPINFYLEKAKRSFR